LRLLGLTLTKQAVDNYATDSAPILERIDFYYSFRTKLQILYHPMKVYHLRSPQPILYHIVETRSQGAHYLAPLVSEFGSNPTGIGFPFRRMCTTGEY
jgi:hypothetical protein